MAIQKSSLHLVMRSLTERSTKTIWLALATFGGVATLTDIEEKDKWVTMSELPFQSGHV